MTFYPSLSHLINKHCSLFKVSKSRNSVAVRLWLCHQIVSTCISVCLRDEKINLVWHMFDFTLWVSHPRTIFWKQWLKGTQLTDSIVWSYLICLMCSLIGSYLFRPSHVFLWRSCGLNGWIWTNCFFIMKARLS